MLKKLTLAAALAATFIGGSAALAHAESGLSTAASDYDSSAWMQQNMRDKMSGAGIAAAPSANTNAYGYAPQTRVHRSHRRG
jgi:hypothetical protein